MEPLGGSPEPPLGVEVRAPSPEEGSGGLYWPPMMPEGGSGLGLAVALFAGNTARAATILRASWEPLVGLSLPAPWSHSVDD